MTRNSKSSSGKSSSDSSAEADTSSDESTGADQWAQAVVDGVPADGTSADEASGDTSLGEDLLDGVPTGDIPLEDASTNDDDVVDAEIDSIPEDWFTEDAAGSGAASGRSAEYSTDISVEDLVRDLERVTTERDQYLDASRRLQAEFENYKKQISKREAQARERANDSLIDELLPVFDAFDGAVANGAEDVVPMRTSFIDALAKQGLERIDPIDGAFDPNLHEAVMHEDADDVNDGPVVAEVMRAGYVWKGRVLRPAMVRTRG